MNESPDTRIIDLVKFVVENSQPSDFNLNDIKYNEPKYSITLTKFCDKIYSVVFESDKITDKSLLHGFSGFKNLNNKIKIIHENKIKDHFRENGV